MAYPTAGVGGSFVIGSATVANVDVWQVPQKAATKDTTSFGASQAFMTNTTTLKSWTGKVTGRADPSDTNGQAVLYASLGATVTVTFKVDSSHNWSGSAIVVGIHPNADVNDVAKIEFDFQGTGVLTYT